MLTYLALGDSYTIGEQVLLSESFPYQLVQRLRSKGVQLCAPEIIARTGWTTDELSSAISSTILQPPYHLVTLLIGVNNQYRGRSVAEFREQFVQLLLTAISNAASNGKVVVLSIPDWGVTPFAHDRDKDAIAVEIDAFNAVCKEESLKRSVPFVDITGRQRSGSADPAFIAADGLHPSKKEYARWAALLEELFTV